MHTAYHATRAAIILVLLLAINFGHPLYHHLEGGALDAILAQINAFAARLAQD
jgi:hypothetical protein